jgi:hypothetical protein
MTDTSTTDAPDLRAALEAEYREWMAARPQYDGDSDANEHLMFNHDLTDEDRAWLEGFAGRWHVMELREQRERQVVFVHTNDVGVAIRDGLDCLTSGVNLFNWKGPEPELEATQYDVSVDASHGFSDLRVMVGGNLFRVSITRIG